MGSQTGRVLPCASINTTVPWIPTYEHYPTMDTYLSLSFHSDTLPEYLPYPTNRRKNTPHIEYLPHLPHPRHLSLHTCTHLTLPFITYHNLHFPTLYYRQGLIK